MRRIWSVCFVITVPILFVTSDTYTSVNRLYMRCLSRLYDGICCFWNSVLFLLCFLVCQVTVWGRMPFLVAIDCEVLLAVWLQFVKRAFSFDTLLKPLPPQLGQSIARNLGFFTRIFTQFFGRSLFYFSISEIMLGWRFAISQREKTSIWFIFPCRCIFKWKAN